MMESRDSKRVPAESAMEGSWKCTDSIHKGPASLKDFGGAC
jgi:hypothetical protein